MVVAAVAVVFLVGWFLILQYGVFQILVMVVPDILGMLILLSLADLEFVAVLFHSNLTGDIILFVFALRWCKVLSVWS